MKTCELTQSLLVVLVIATLTLPGTVMAQDGPAKGTTTIPTYVGDISYQHQTLSKASAEKIHRQKALSRASELVLWSMPAMGFYQAFKAVQENLNGIAQR